MDAPHVDVAPLAASIDRRVDVRASRVHLHDLTLNRVSVVDYLRTIAPDKQELALVHALEIGITEIQARRRRDRAGLIRAGATNG